MPNTSFTVTVIDCWPKLKVLILRGGNARDEGPVQYDIAQSQFTPAVTDALRLCVEEIIRKRKGE